MHLLDAYYLVKPIVPRRLQLALRQALASQKRKAAVATWPIDDRTSGIPTGWEGWPEGKMFALVLLHDVDSVYGAQRCLSLMEAERRRGFRSSFHFVPERYRLPSNIKEELVASGFEVGVHGLKHDGKLFKNRKVFNRGAGRINAYLKEWRAVGFSSPSMLSNLHWIAEMEVEYSCSSFDSDPFEPQNDAVRTIFPFMVSNEDGSRAYVELPYTLPQDHCLFVVLRETGIGIWEQKLDWIAENGGMALLLSHPDYMNFSGAKCTSEQYPASHYTDFLDFIKNKYAGRFWHPLPRELARFWRISRPC